jgi:uncharacterized protein YjiS (DUF1127 family)
MEASMSNLVLMDPWWQRLKHGVGSWYRDLRSHRELMDLDDRMLRDIGLSRDETPRPAHPECCNVVPFDPLTLPRAQQRNGSYRSNEAADRGGL